jgi:C-terminal processing protease CtpA/Prc
MYSQWHYLLLTPAGGNLPRLDKPVIILMNSKCFSATDIFLSALKGLPNVTVLGTPSAGGSANINTVTLGHPLIRARLGTMISFQTSGQFFDGQGVKPDIHVEPAADFFIGREDNQLAAALAVIKEHANKKPQ